MSVTLTDLPGVFLIQPTVHRDERGFFLESYHEKKFMEKGVPVPFVQDNHTNSVKGALRGLHGQLKNPQHKLIRVIHGEIFDVAVDIRKGSPTFGRWTSAVLSSSNFLQIFIPAGFLHGFCVLSDGAEVEYKCSAYYDPSDEIGVRWDDPDLKIDWPIKSPILSYKDQSLPTLATLKSKLHL